MNKLAQQQQRDALNAISISAIVEFADCAIIGINLDGTVTSWNPGAERIFGYAASEMIGASILKIIPPERQAEEHGILARMARGESVRHFETVRRTKDGRLLDISMSVSPIRDAGNRIVGASKIAHDIGERKRIEQARRASAAHPRSFFDNTSYGILITDPENRFLDANLSACRMLGYAHEELVGLRAEDIVKPSEIPHIEPAAEAIRANADYRREWQFRRKNGSFFTADVSALVMPDGNLMGIIRRVTEQDREKRELRSTKRQLQVLLGRLNFAREEEAKRIARELHDDLGQQLTALNMEVDALEREQPDATVRQKSQIVRMHAIVNHTVESVQKIASNLRLSQLDVFGLTAAIEWQLKEFSRRSAIPCRITRMDEFADPSEAKNTAIFRILQETLTNIARHARATEVEVSLEAGLDQLSLRVHDNGRGITEAEMKSKKAIGLLGMHERAQIIGGDVTITGEPGLGTTVLARIPQNQIRPSFHEHTGVKNPGL